MGYSRNYLNYPEEMGQAVRRAFEREAELTFPTESEQRAKSIRGQFYAYFRALREAAFKQDIPDRENILDLYNMCCSVVVKTEGNSVIVSPKISVAELRTLREVLRAELEEKK